MRKMCCQFLVAAILAVSILPVLPIAAKFCTLDDAHIHTTHHHGVVLNMDLQTARIECACGCHRNVDSLPHLLAPHTISLTNLDTTLPIMRSTSEQTPALKARLFPLSTPPPIYS